MIDMPQGKHPLALHNVSSLFFHCQCSIEFFFLVFFSTIYPSQAH